MSTILYQVVSAFIIQLNVMMFGVTACIPGTTLLLFKSENTTLDRPMTMTEISFYASLFRVSALFITPFMAYLLDALGRKRCIIMLAGNGVIFWIILLFARKVEVVIFSVFIAGFISPMFLVGAIFVGEISQEHIRGTLLSCSAVSYNVGILVGFLIGGFLEYHTMLWTGTTMALIGLLLLCILKESPTILMKKGLEKEAAKSMAFYRNAKEDSKIVQDDLNKIRKVLAPLTTEMTSEEEKLTNDFKGIVPPKTLSKWEFFKQSESTRKAFYLNSFLVASSIFQGMVVVQTYAKLLFHEAVPEDVMSTTWCCVLLSIIVVVFGVVGASLTDFLGRRFLMIYTTMGTGLCHLALGSQIQFGWGPPWLTALFVYLFCIAFALGPGSVPFVLLAEVFLPEIKGLMSTAVIQVSWMCSFVNVFVFNPLVNVLGLGSVFYIFASASFVTTIVCSYALPETKGLTTEAIQLMFIKKKNKVPA